MIGTIMEMTFTIVVFILILAHASEFSAATKAVTDGYSSVVRTLTSNAPFGGQQAA